MHKIIYMHKHIYIYMYIYMYTKAQTLTHTQSNKPNNPLHCITSHQFNALEEVNSIQQCKEEKKAYLIIPMGALCSST